MDSTGTTGASSAPNAEDLNKPMWKYVTRYEKPDEGGGNATFVIKLQRFLIHG